MNYNLIYTETSKVINNFGNLFAVFIIGITFLCLIFWLIREFSETKAHRYRKYLTHMYVSAFIRKKAKEEDLDLDQEEKNCLSYCRNSDRRKFRDLDDRIEQALSEEMEETILNKEEKKK